MLEGLPEQEIGNPVEVPPDAEPPKEPEQPIEVKTEKPKRSPKVRVTVVHALASPVPGRSIVIGEDTAWLVEHSKLPSPETIGDISLASDILDRSPVAYDFADEIQSVLPTVQEIARSFWRYGIVSKDDLNDKTKVKRALAMILPNASHFNP